MKMYNITTDTIVNNMPQTLEVIGANVLTSKMDEITLNSLGYYKVQYGIQPKRRYYTYNESKLLVGNLYEVTYTVVDKPLAEVQDLLKTSVKNRFISKQENPVVDSTLGFMVDGKRIDLENFKIGQKYAFSEIKATDNLFYSVTDADYTTIITAIETYGISLYQAKWTKYIEVDALITVSDCVLYEATPYDYIITAQDVTNDISSTLVAGDIQVRYTNNSFDC
jgi:hypothetical protein